MLKIAIGLGVAACVAMSPPTQAGTPTYLPMCPMHMRQPGSKYGVASWYGQDFDGSPTASGEAFNANALTAANRDLPLGTEIRVTNLRNQRSLLLRVNDRGPYVPGRTLDVSRAAAHRLGFIDRGNAPVQIQVVKLPQSSHSLVDCPGARKLAVQ